MSSNIRNIGFILLYISIWLSLDSSLYNVVNLKYSEFFDRINVNELNNINNIKSINYTYLYHAFVSIRFVFPYIIFIVLAILFRNDLFLIKLKSKFKYIIYLILFSFFLQAITLIFTENNIYNITFAFSSIILLMNLIFFYYYFDLKKIFLIGLSILFFITTIYGSALIYHLFFEAKILHLYGSWPQNLEALQFLSNEVPRSSGISRSSLILLIPLGFYFLISKKLNYKIYIIYLFFSFLMLSTQSRITLLGYFLGTVVFFYYIFFNNRNYKFTGNLKKFFIIIILPIIFWASSVEILGEIKNSPAFIEMVSDLSKSNNKDKTSSVDDIQKYKGLIRPSDSSFTSQRAEDWQNIIKKNDNYVLGYGALGDRHLIDQSASSLFFYNYASGGLLSVFIFLILIFRSIFICFKIIFKWYKTPDKDNYLVLSACFIIIFLIIRSIVESSFAVFGIDSLVFFSSYFYVEQSYKKL